MKWQTIMGVLGTSGWEKTKLVINCFKILKIQNCIKNNTILISNKNLYGFKWDVQKLIFYNWKECFTTSTINFSPKFWIFLVLIPLCKEFVFPGVKEHLFIQKHWRNHSQQMYRLAAKKPIKTLFVVAQHCQSVT